jgi:hypothetical protein
MGIIDLSHEVSRGSAAPESRRSTIKFNDASAKFGRPLRYTRASIDIAYNMT